MSKKIICFIGGLLISLIGYSQVPGNFSYQAVIRDESNNLVQESNVSIRISILQELYSSTPIYSEVHFLETNANGLLTLQVGTGEAEIGNFNSIDWLKGDFFLKSEVDITGGDNYTISSTSQLLSVPYALVATRSQKSDSSEYAENAKRALIADSVINLPQQQVNSKLKPELRGDTLFLPDSSFVVIPGLGGINTYRKPFSITYGGRGNDYAYSVEQTSDEGYIIAGSTKSDDGDISDGNNGSDDMWVIKLDSEGNKEWDKTYGGSGSDYGGSIIQTKEGGYIILGITNSEDGDISDGNNGLGDIWIIKLDSEGNKEWDKTYGGSNWEFSGEILETIEDGYIITGITNSEDGDISDGNNGGDDIWIIKLDSEGNKEWDKTLGGAIWEFAEKIFQTKDGGYIIVGDTFSDDGDISDGNNGYEDIWIIKLDSEGNKEWDKTYGGSGSDYGSSIIQTKEGGYIASGLTASNDGDVTNGNNGGLDIWIIKLDSEGNKEWDKTYGGSGNEYAVGYRSLSNDIFQIHEGKFLVFTQTSSNDGDISDGNNGGDDIWIIKLDSEGNKEWDKTYGGSNSDRGYSVKQVKNGKYILAGVTSSNDGDVSDGNNGYYDVWVLKLDSKGNIVLVNY